MSRPELEPDHLLGEVERLERALATCKAAYRHVATERTDLRREVASLRDRLEALCETASRAAVLLNGPGGCDDDADEVTRLLGAALGDEDDLERRHWSSAEPDALAGERGMEGEA